MSENGVFRWALEIQQAARAAHAEWRSHPNQDYWMDRMDQIIDRLGMEGRRLRDALFGGSEQSDALLGRALREALGTMKNASTLSVQRYTDGAGYSVTINSRHTSTTRTLRSLLAHNYASKSLLTD